MAFRMGVVLNFLFCCVGAFFVFLHKHAGTDEEDPSSPGLVGAEDERGFTNPYFALGFGVQPEGTLSELESKRALIKARLDAALTNFTSGYDSSLVEYLRSEVV